MAAPMPSLLPYLCVTSLVLAADIVGRVPDAPAAEVATADSPAPRARQALLARLGQLNQSGQFLFGQENATLWGMSLDGRVVSTKEFYERSAAAGEFTSDSA